jgi:hypothetical protein
MHRRLMRLLPVIIGIIALSILYGQLLLPGRALAERDIPGLHLPMLTDLARVGAEGIPYWNPSIHGGQPLLTNPHYATFYPPTWMIFLLPVDYVIGLLVFLHALWAFVGAWRLARRWGCESAAASLAAVAFVGGGAFVSSPNLLNLFLGMAWLPWVLGWGEEALRQPARGQWITAGFKTTLGIAAQILVGSPIMPLLSLLALACMAFESAPDRWGRALRLVPIAGSSVAISAIQLLPTLRHVADSTRGSGLHERIATTWSTPPVRLAELFWPRIYGDPMLADSMFYFGYPGVERPVPLILYIYCGAIIMALAIGGLLDKTLPYRRSLIAMTLLGVFLALGRYNPLYTSVLIKVPPFSVIRFPEKFLLLSVTAIVFAAALAWQGILSAGLQDRIAKLKVPTLVACVVLLLTGILYITPLVAPDVAVRLLEGTSAEKVEWYEPLEEGAKLPPNVLAARAGYLGRETFVSGVFWLAALALLRLHTRTRVPTTWLSVLVLGLLTVELTYYSSEVNNTVPSDLIRQPPQTLENLPPSTGRVFSDAILFRDRDFFIPSPDTGVPASLQRFLLRVDPYSANLWGYSYALGPDPDMMLSRWGTHALNTFRNDSTLFDQGWSEKVLRYLGTWNVGIVVRRRSPKAQMDEKERTGSMPAPARLLENPWILDRFRFVNRVAYDSDIATAVERVGDRNFDLRDFDVVVDPATRTPGTSRDFDSQAQLIAVEDHASRILIDYQARKKAFLVAAITADRDWSARVDGASTPIQVTALGQMGIELPAGSHRLVLEHRNPVLIWGALISGLALLACATPLITRTMRHGD